ALAFTGLVLAELVLAVPVFGAAAFAGAACAAAFGAAFAGVLGAAFATASASALASALAALPVTLSRSLPTPDRFAGCAVSAAAPASFTEVRAMLIPPG